MFTSLTDQEIVKLFREIPSCNVADAMDNLKLPRAIVQGLTPLSYQQPRTAGWAHTYKHIPRHQDSEGIKLVTHNELLSHEASPDDVVVIDSGGSTDVANLGEFNVMCAMMRGVNGVLIDGCTRDVQEILALNFPVHCRGISPVKSSPDMETIGVNLPVYIGGCHIRPGDLIVGDDSGIVVVSRKNIPAVLEEALKIKKNEDTTRERLSAELQAYYRANRSES